MKKILLALILLGSSIGSMHAVTKQGDAAVVYFSCGFLSDVDPIKFNFHARLGTSKSGIAGYIGSCDQTFYVDTQKMLLTAIVAAVLVVAYKKGYFGKIKDYVVSLGKKAEEKIKEII